MANPDHVEILLKGAEVWNAWRKKNSHIKPDLSDFTHERFDGTRDGYIMKPFYKADIDLGEHEHGYKTDFRDYDLSNSILDNIDFRKQDLSKVSLTGASMKGCNFENQYLIDKDLQKVNLAGANLKNTRIIHTDLSGSCLIGVDLRNSQINESILKDCDLTEAKVYGSSVWDVNLENSTQRDIVITKEDQAVIAIDNLKVAQFVYLIINYAEIRDVIDTVAQKVVLILGNFSDERKKILHRIRDELREIGFVPILFEFKKPERRNMIETIRILARLSKFIIADLTDARSVPAELQSIIEISPSVAIQPIIISSQNEYGMYDYDLPWVFETFSYDDEDHLFSNLHKEVIEPANNYLG